MWKNEEGLTLLELISVMIIGSILLTGVLTMYNFVFLTVSESMEDANKRQTIQQIDQELTSSFLLFEREVNLSEDGNRLQVGEDEFSYDEEDRQLTIHTEEEERTYKQVMATREGLFEKEGQVVDVAFMVVDRRGEQTFAKSYIIQTDRFNEDYFTEEEDDV